MESIFKLANSQGASPFSSSQVNALPSGGNGQWSQGQKSGQTGSPYGAFINQLKTRAQWSRRNGGGAMPSRGSGTGQSILPWTGGQQGMSSTETSGQSILPWTGGQQGMSSQPRFDTQPYTPNGPTGMPAPPPVNRPFARETPQGADGGQGAWYSDQREFATTMPLPYTPGGGNPVRSSPIPPYLQRVIDQRSGGSGGGYSIPPGSRDLGGGMWGSPDQQWIISEDGQRWPNEISTTMPVQINGTPTGGGQVSTMGPVVNGGGQPAPQGDNIVGQNQGNSTQQQYNNAGMGGSYIGSSQNAHVDVSKLPKALQMLASYGVPLTPALIAAVTGQSLPPADPARAFQARGGGILPSYQTFGQMSPDERELFQSYTMGPVGLPWNNTAAAMQAPTANFRSAVRAY